MKDSGRDRDRDRDSERSENITHLMSSSNFMASGCFSILFQL